MRTCKITIILTDTFNTNPNFDTIVNDNNLITSMIETFRCNGLTAEITVNTEEV